MRSKISKVLGVCNCKKHKTTTRNSCSPTIIPGDLESMTAAATNTCHGNDQKKHLGSDAFAQYSETNDTMFPPFLNYELDGTDQVFTAGNSVRREFPRWGTDESSNKIWFDNQTCNVSDLYTCNLLTSSPFDESGNSKTFAETCRLHQCIFPEKDMVLPDLEDGSANPSDIKSDVDGKISLYNQDLSQAFNQTRSHNMEPEDHAESEKAVGFNCQRSLIDQLELAKYIFNCWPNSPRKKSVTLVLDLDETLIHSTGESCNVADFSFSIFANKKETRVYVKQRPHLFMFLERVVELFHVFIFTASFNVYASPLLDILDPYRKFISQRFYRDSCILKDGICTKDLTVLGLDLAKVAIIDNSPQVYRLQKNNGIPITSWYNDPNDDCLVTILPFLETLADADDVRPIIERRFGCKE